MHTQRSTAHSVSGHSGGQIATKKLWFPAVLMTLRNHVHFSFYSSKLLWWSLCCCAAQEGLLPRGTLGLEEQEEDIFNYGIKLSNIQCKMQWDRICPLIDFCCFCHTYIFQIFVSLKNDLRKFKMQFSNWLTKPTFCWKVFAPWLLAVACKYTTFIKCS